MNKANIKTSNQSMNDQIKEWFFQVLLPLKVHWFQLTNSTA